MTFISVIVPSFNHAQFLKQRIDSVLSQTYPAFEIIILDDASTDNSKEIIELFRYKVSHIVYNPKNSGSPFGMWGQGLNLAKGQWIWIAESDDFASPDFLRQCADKIQMHESIGICYCDSYIFDESKKQLLETYSEQKIRLFATNKWGNPYFNNGIDEINESLKYNCNINNVSAMLFKKSLAMPIVPQLALFNYYGDWFFCIRLLLVSDIFYVPKPLNTCRVHPSSHLNKTTSLVTSRQEYFKIFMLLYHEEKISNKAEMLSGFTYNHLSFGFYKDGPNVIYRILKSYFLQDWKLALKVIGKIFSIKLFNTYYKNNFDIVKKTSKN